MFRLYSRRVDRRIFSDINHWLARRDDFTDPEELRRFVRNAEKTSPEEFFSLSKRTRVELKRTSEYPLTYTFRFDSPLPSGYEENDRVQGECLPEYSLSSPAAILLSGWLEGASDYSRLASWVGRCGRNLWAMDLPYHMRRAPQGTRSGELAVTPDLVRTLKAVRQAVVDARVLISAIWELGSRDIALLGFSLGGWVASLLALSEPKVSKAVLVTPVVRPDELFLYSPFFSSLREKVRVEERLNAFDQIPRLFLPKQGEPLVEPGRIHLIGSHEDPLATPASVKELASSWGCEVEIIAGGHITVYLTGRLWRRIFSLLHPNQSLRNWSGTP